jgi:hypothetical protein
MKTFEQYLNESSPRYCNIYLARDKRWYMDLSEKEYGEYKDATTYGPFNSEDEVHQFLDRFANLESFSSDASGREPIPKRSPNGSRVIKPLLGGGKYPTYKTGSWR